jgi:hypothetical protein
VAPVVLFCKNAPPMSKIILDRQPDSSKSASKQKRVPHAAAPPESRSRHEGLLPGKSRKGSDHLFWIKRLQILTWSGFALGILLS